MDIGSCLFRMNCFWGIALREEIRIYASRWRVLLSLFIHILIFPLFLFQWLQIFIGFPLLGAVMAIPFIFLLFIGTRVVLRRICQLGWHGVVLTPDGITNARGINVAFKDVTAFKVDTQGMKIAAVCFKMRNIPTSIPAYSLRNRLFYRRGSDVWLQLDCTQPKPNDIGAKVNDYAKQAGAEEIKFDWSTDLKGFLGDYFASLMRG